MKRFILTIGPRSSGKTTFCQNYVASHSHVVLVSPDLLRQKMEQQKEKMREQNHLLSNSLHWRMVGLLLKRRVKNLDIIFDLWNMTAAERSAITAKAKEMGVDQIQGWHFVTPDYFCLKWNSSKVSPERSKTIEFALKHLREFRQQEIDLNQGFDHIRLIDPLKMDPASFIILNTLKSRT